MHDELASRLRRSADMLQPGSEPEVALRVAADALSQNCEGCKHSYEESNHPLMCGERGYGPYSVNPSCRSMGYSCGRWEAATAEGRK